MKTNQAADTVSLVIFGLIIVALVVRGAVWHKVNAFMAQGWPTCQGTVEFGNVEVRETRYKNFYVGRIDYSYSVNGEFFSGYLERLFVRESSAYRFVDGMKKQLVFVRYNQNRPERSILLKEDQPAGWPA